MDYSLSSNPHTAVVSRAQLLEEALQANRHRETLHTAADWIVRHGLTTPILFFLELHRPLQGIFRMGLVFSEPLLGAIFGFKRSKNWNDILNSPEAFDELIALLEVKDLERQ